MTKFGKQLRKSIIPEWQNEYINFKKLKKMIKEFLLQLKENKGEQNKNKINNTEDTILIKSDRVERENSNLTNPESRSTLNNLNVNLVSFTHSNSYKTLENYEDFKIAPQSVQSPAFSIDSQYDKLLLTDPDKKIHSMFLKNFLNNVDQEIRKVYLFYSSIEREIYLQINTLLHRRKNYASYTMKDVYKELDSLVKVSHITRSFCFYINDNMMAIKKILKKFDKKMNKFFGFVTVKYLRSKLENPNSDFSYMLQYKIIDESNALIEDMMKELKSNFLKGNRSINFEKSKSNAYFENNFNTTQNQNLNQDLLLAHRENLDNSNNYIHNDKSSSSFNASSISDFEKKYDEKSLRLKIRRKIRELEKYISSIDETSHFRSKIKDWNFYIKNGYTIIHNHINLKAMNGEAHRSMMVVHTQDDEEVIKKFLPESERNKITKSSILSTDNRSNIILSLMHTFLYMLIYSNCQSTNSEYLQKIETDGIYSGLMMGLTPLAAILSSITLSKWSNYSYKQPMIVSVIFFIIGSFLYASAYNFKSIIMIALGRFLIGLGSGRSVNRRYLIQFIPKTLITKFSFYYVLAGGVGYACGPLCSFIFIYLETYDNVFDFFSFNIYTYPGWFGLIISLLMLILIFIGYSEPIKHDFNIFEPDECPKNILTSEEKTMINEIDDKLKEINKENNFSDTNLVQYNIENIKIKQRTGFSYIYKCFLIMFSILFSLRVCNESLLIIFPYYLIKYDFSDKFVSLYMTGSLFLIIPSSLVFKKLAIKFPRERKALIYLLVLTLLFCIFIIDYIFDSVIKFCICFSFLIILTNLIESLSSSLLAKIIPTDWELGTFNAGFLITIATTSGKTFGCFMQTISALIAGKENIILITYGFCSFLFLFIVIMFICYYSELRVKALARLLKNPSLGKV